MDDFEGLWVDLLRKCGVGVKLVIPSNKSEGAYDVMLEIGKYIDKIQSQG